MLQQWWLKFGACVLDTNSYNVIKHYKKMWFFQQENSLENIPIVTMFNLTKKPF